MSETQASGWRWFDPNPAATPDAIGIAFQQCFATPAGRVVLNHLRETYLERRLGPDSSDGQLRYLEGARMVAAYIERQARPNNNAAHHKALESIA